MSPGPQGTSLGVDFGTSHTIAVVRRADGSLRPLLFDGAPLMPSAVCADADGGLLVGRDAVHAGRRHPERFEPNPKRLIDRPSTLLGAREYPVPDLIAAVLHAVAEECRRVVGSPAQVTLTVPAEWGPARRQVVEDAAARSGLGRVRLVPEPVAAATYYAEALKHRMAVGASIVVYDLGAGTFDASVVRRTDDGFSTVALDGRSDLGGLDIDAALIDHLGGTYGDREGWKRLMHPTTIEERRHFRDFQEEIRGAKERLSRHQQSDIAIPLLDVEAHLTRTELEAIAQPHLEQTIRVTQAVIRAAGLDVAASAGVFLVGGASRMPLVATMLHRSLGVAPTVLDQPEIVVAEGSVLWQAGADGAAFPLQRNDAAMLVTPAANPGLPNPAPTPQAAFAVAPVTEPQAPQQDYEYRPSPPEPVTAPAAPVPQQSPVRQTLPPQTYQPAQQPPIHTPPRPQVSATRDDTDAPEPPLTEAERQRRKRIGNRAVVAIILVNVLVIAGLAWYFGPYNNDDGGDDSASYAPSFDPYLVSADLGMLAGEIEGAHDEAVVSLTTAETAGETMLFSAEAGGLVHQWSMTTGERVSSYTLDIAIDSLHSTLDIDGDPVVVAVDTRYSAHVWTPDSEMFSEAGTPDLAEAGDVGRVSVGTAFGTPVLAVLNDTEMELFDLDSSISQGVLRIPEGGGWANFYAMDGELSYAVAVHPDHTLMDVNAADGEVLGMLEDTGEWTSDVDVAALRIVYHGDSTHAMLLGSDGLLYFWDLATYEPSLPPMPLESDYDKFHDEIVETSDGPSIMFIDGSGNGYVKSLDTWEPIAFDDDSGAFTEMATVESNGTRFAVTGDEYGNIQFWSLGL